MGNKDSKEQDKGLSYLTKIYTVALLLKAKGATEVGETVKKHYFLFEIEDLHTYN